MATKLFCDLCGKEIERNRDDCEFHITRQRLGFHEEKIDAHDECVRKLFAAAGITEPTNKWLIVEDHALGPDGNRGVERIIRDERFDSKEQAEAFEASLEQNGWITRFTARESDGFHPEKVGDPNWT